MTYYPQRSFTFRIVKETFYCVEFLDADFQSDFVTSELVERLGLKQFPISVPISGVRESSAETHNYVNMIVQSCLNGFKAECFGAQVPCAA